MTHIHPTTNIADEHWARLLRELLQSPFAPDRTGVGTYRLFSHTMKFDMRHGFPLVSLKTVSWKDIWEELRWMLSGSTNIKDLNSSIWNEWANENGDLGPVYGAQWRRWHGGDDGNANIWIDQIDNLITGLRENPYGRRHVVSAWNPGELDDMALPPCHALFQVFCGTDNSISLQMYQRSCDVFLGLPYNIGGYAFLLEMLALLTGRKAHTLAICIGDAHLYSNHRDAAIEVLRRYEATEKVALFEQSAQVQMLWHDNDPQIDRPFVTETIDGIIARVKPVIIGYQGKGKIAAEVAV